MAKNEIQNYIKKSEAVSCTVYVLAKLGYPRHKIEEVTRELRNTFQLKCNSYTFETSLVTGRVDRNHLLPTIYQPQKPDSSGKKDDETS
ncbi:hypothetical protein ACFO25_11350 [Paenactinomyces guangxiensis]|uniref:Uncharacterized protein n=1 Tax=Paenactinomyces guangxiensis TaxID=1490290 RepID=A0A7W1WQD6_9BACL|nr:hypothetical protein [Paenactinomyces guangxiensis]MBA4494009.1 hypothetical protein [Paenactinomyces guangxiensis]MBH8591246.1 hypothetical protein [Paenactinomyces guangxiensis]